MTSIRDRLPPSDIGAMIEDEGGAPLVASSFKTGEVVMLKSGGPPMTVAQMRDGLVDVSWFDGGIRMRDAFEPDELKAAAQG